ncbi:MAG: aminofutalosine synthase MqnE [Nitrospirae bacterium]|nr:MAG: aminofutalosine synthase MqnE [Nitrospirota bacterium]
MGDPTFDAIAAKVEAGERLTEAEALALFEGGELNRIGALANRVRQARHGRDCYFNVNRHLNPTNVCVYRCQFCGFRRDGHEPDAYLMSVEEALARLEGAEAAGITEVHIVGGMTPKAGLAYYERLLRAIREAHPALHIKAFTAVEIAFFCRLEGISHRACLERLVEAGLDSMPGGGAEIFAERVRRQVCKEKAGAEEWLAVHRTAHELGLRTNATMLYGHVETLAERVDHMARLRRLQDETGGFQVFIPLAYHNENNPLAGEMTTAFDDLRTLAIARLFLDNFDHIKSFWVMHTPELAQVALHYGVDDLDGTVTEERITAAAGGRTAGRESKEALVELIRAAGFVPVERSTVYQELARF